LLEAAHRVRNDLTTISSMIRLQKSRVNAECREILETFEHRLTVLVRVHQRLDISRGKISVDSNAFLENLIDDLRTSQVGIRDIMIETEIESHMLSHRDSVALGLIVNEAVTNAIKYAFNEDELGTIEVTFYREGKEAILIIKDDGHNTGTIQGSGLGTKLMRSMATQVSGALDVEIDNGTRVTVRFP
ncbi:MAG: sensor histidine kinase, partial [Verrucomicrobiaceae bacterium]